MKNLKFCSLHIFVFWIVFKRSQSNTHTLYDTKKATSDLGWTLFPSYDRWEEVSSLDVDGNTIRSYQVCNVGELDQNNWIRSPFIDVKSAKRIYVDIEFSVMKCPGCRETFTIYYYQSSVDVASSTFPPWRENPYVKLDTIAAGERFASSDPVPSGINKKTLVIESIERSGLYLAVQDEGACMALMSLKIYYFYCPETIHNLAYFPETPAGGRSASLVPVTGNCTSKTLLAEGTAPVYRCNSNGQWMVPTGSCVCKPGFFLNLDDNTCQECPSGSFKSLRGNHVCKKCPANSETTRTASTLCSCAPGYYRSKSGSIEEQCSRPPSAPCNLTYHRSNSSLQLSWLPPLSSVNRQDLYYSVMCKKCDDKFQECTTCQEKIVSLPRNRLHVTGTSLEVNHLEPFSNYLFEITSLNDVSSVSSESAASAAIKIPSEKSLPSKVKSIALVRSDQRSLSLDWSSASGLAEQGLTYEVQVQEVSKTTEESTILLEVKGCNATITKLNPATQYRIRIRVASPERHGTFSAPYFFSTLSDSNLAPRSETKNAVPLIAGVAGGVAVVLILIITAILIKRRRFKRKKKFFIKDKLSDQSQLSKFGAENHSTSSKGGNTRKTYVDYRDPHQGIKEAACEIKPSQVKIERVIGRGEFAEVCKAKLMNGKKTSVTVAVKRLRYGANLIDQTNFFREACTMAQFSHPNVIEFKGIVTKCVPPMIITEFMENGSLDRLLQKKRGELSMLQLLKMLKGIASGMNYLSGIKYIHRDLAARNILVDSELNCKISDFGLSRTIENDPHATYTTQGGKIALRWTAPECIRRRQFSTASDVWSFGILMWEVMSYGEKPYWDMSNDDVSQVIEDGYRLPAPANCPQALYKVMLQCWLYNDKKRPSFKDILNQLESFIRQPSLLANNADDDLSTPLLTPINSTPLQDATDLNQWLELARNTRHRSRLHSHGAQDLEALSRLSASDFERLGVAVPGHRTSLQTGLDSVRRHLATDHLLSLTSRLSTSTDQSPSVQSFSATPSLHLDQSEPGALV